MTLIDANVLIDIFSDDPRWFDWSRARLEEALLRGPLLINDVIYAETSIRFRNLEHLDADLVAAGIDLARIPRAALFLAGKTFTSYRRAGGTRTSVLPDFFIGAHAAVEGLPLLTRDVARYRSYFPMVTLISPE